jgi:hypothetical protein
MSKWLEALDAALAAEIPEACQRANLQNLQKPPFESFEGAPVEAVRDFLSETCCGCQRFTASRINPVGGLGLCASRRRLYVGAARACSGFEPAERKVGVSEAFSKGMEIGVNQMEICNGN